MTAPVRSLACTLTLAAILSPGAMAVWAAVHLALDAHHREAAPAADDGHRHAATVLHGHHHDHGIPAHSHDTTAAAAARRLPSPALTIDASAAGSVSATPTAASTFVARFESCPPQRVPIILRI